MVVFPVTSLLVLKWRGTASIRSRVLVDHCWKTLSYQEVLKAAVSEVLGRVHCGSKEGCNGNWSLTTDGFLARLPERLPVKALRMTVSLSVPEDHLQVYY